MSWPTSVLSSTNRQLVEEVNRLGGELAAKRAACDQHREVVDLMRANLAQTRRQAQHVAQTLTDAQNTMVSEDSELKILRNECYGASRAVASLQEERSRLQRMHRQALAATQAQRAALEEAREEAIILEEVAQEEVRQHLTRQKVGEELQAEMEILSSSITARLSRLHQEVQQQETTLNAAVDEHRVVLAELDQARDSMRAALQDHREGVEALSLMHNQFKTADETVLRHAEAMSAAQAEMAEKQAVLSHLMEKHADYEKHLARAKKARAEKRQFYDSRVNALREIVASMQSVSGPTEVLRRQLAANRQCARQLRATLENIVNQLSEKTSAFAHTREDLQRLQEVALPLLKQQEEAGASAESLNQLFRTLQRELQVLEDRADKAQARVGQAVQLLVQEGMRGESIQDEVARQRAAYVAMERETSTMQETQKRTRDTEQALAVRLADLQDQLPGLQSAAMSAAEVRRREQVEHIAELRQQLLQSMSEYRTFVRDVSTLRGTLRRSNTALVDAHSRQEHLASSSLELSQDVNVLEAELQELEQTANAVESYSSREVVTLQALQSAAREQVGTLRDAAGMEAHLRAHVQIEEARIEADMHSARVEHNLQLAAQRELKEELRRHQRQRDLYRVRYEELMKSLAGKQQREMGEAGSTMLGGITAALDHTAAPEALHARLLLQRSFEREQLMEKGNYLDLRLLALEKETLSLQRMLESLRRDGGNNNNNNIKVTTALAEKKRAHRELLPPADEQQGQKEAMACLQDGLVAREQMLHAELERQDSFLQVMSERREGARERMRALTQTLKTLQATEKRKRMQLQKLRDEFHKERRTHKASNM